MSTPRRSRFSPSTASGSCTVPGRTGTSAVASHRSTSSTRRGSPSESAPTVPPRLPPLDLFEEIRTAIVSARARAGRPDALTAAAALELATLGGARVLGLDAEIGSLVPGKQADLTVISLEDSPFDPIQDPAAAAVLGGSPERVTATLVGGEQRYRKGTTAWPDSTRAARSARSRMLP